VSVDFSVIVCTYNRSGSLHATLESLAALDVPAGLSWEALVVDNGSTDRTAETAAAFRSVLPALRYVYEPDKGLSRARNAGIRRARGQVLAFLDDDVRVEARWLQALGEAYRQYPAACVAGRVLLAPELRRPAWWDSRFDAPLGKFDRGPAVILSTQAGGALLGIGANISFRRDVFERHGLFRTDLGRQGSKLLMGEETELCARLRRNGELIVHYPAALVLHAPDVARFTKRYLRRWYFRIGEWRAPEVLQAEAHLPRILGVPRWRFRAAAADAVAALRHACAGRRGEAFAHQVVVVEFLGILRATIRRRPTPANSPAATATVAHR
jgi:glycosyltransferase involved in cell wall biosynthesis